MSTKILQPRFIVTRELREQFFAKKTLVSGELQTMCWRFSGHKCPKGYGKLRFKGKVMRAHVIAWRIAHEGKPVPIGMEIMHRCNNPSCINPDHLEAGTHKENMQHAVDSGMGAKIAANLPDIKGEDHYRAKMTVEKVVEARQMHEQGQTVDSVAKHFGMSRWAMWKIINRQSWKHV